jgi:hypothetical protein
MVPGLKSSAKQAIATSTMHFVEKMKHEVCHGRTVSVSFLARSRTQRTANAKKDTSEEGDLSPASLVFRKR